jgi:thiol:disulfide interchange protein DsbC
MKLSAFVAAFSLAAFMGLSAHAEDADKGKADTDRVKTELKKRLPEAPVDTVRKVPYAGLYEVIVGGDIFYTDAKGEFLVAGSIIDLKTKENVTEARNRQMNAIKWDTLPLDQAIKIVRGNGSRKIAIFEDPNCGYCKRLERDLQGVNDLTMYVFLYPILSPDSVEKSKAIWCSADRAKLWVDHMVRDTAISGDTKCATPIDKILALGQSKKVQGTPTIVFENGERVPGAIPVADLEKKFADIKVAANAPAAAAK